MEFFSLLIQTVLLRPYVFLFLGMSLFSAIRLLGWRRTSWMFGLTWVIAFLCEFSSTRNGFPFGDYYYTGSTIGQELYLSNIPFMDSLSFTFLLYASYCLALTFVLSVRHAGVVSEWDFNVQDRTSWPVVMLTTLFMMFIDIVIDPVALRGDRWFLGLIYGYTHPGVYFGVPLENFLGWATVGFLSIGLYCVADRHHWFDISLPQQQVGGNLLLGVGLYYLVLLFNLLVTFLIGETLIGLVGCLIYLPISLLITFRIFGQAPMPIATDR
ncbi:carotenoid biosynthesis protein [Candidatus Nitrospira salsa]